jgi:hypothetical protein
MRMAGRSRNRLVTASLRLYEMLLLAYPREFREEYGSHMLQVFGDRCRQQIRDSGPEGMLGWWLVTAIDFVNSLLEQHLRRENHMTRTTLIRIGAWSLILAAVAFVVIALQALPQEVGDLFVWALTVATFLTSVGTVGVILGFGAAAQPTGTPMLIVGLVGSLLIYTAALPFMIWTDPYWIIPFMGTGILLACLAGYGLIALRRGFLPVDTSASLAAGIWFALLLIAAAVFPLQDVPHLYIAACLVTGSLITAFALARLGWILLSRQAQVTSATA